MSVERPREKNSADTKPRTRRPADEAFDQDRIDSREMLRVLSAVRKGDFSARMRGDQIGLAGKIADTLNEIIEQNEHLSSEHERISDAVGKEGRLTQRASIPGASGAWRSSFVAVEGEILEFKNTINTMVDQLRAFAAEVTRVAKEVGTEGRLGGQANVEGVGGTWKDLTESVNDMASNLTGQVRNIADAARRE